MNAKMQRDHLEMLQGAWALPTDGMHDGTLSLKVMQAHGHGQQPHSTACRAQG